MLQPAASIVMVTFQHSKYIEAAVESSLNQTVTNIEIIVVDDGSSDGTSEKLAHFRDPRLTVIRQANSGPSLALNRAIATAKSEFLALSSGDDINNPDRIERQLSAITKHKVDAVFGRPSIIDDDGNPLPDASPHSRVFFNAAPHGTDSFFRTLFMTGNFLCAPSAMVRRSALNECGAFHPALYQLQDFHMWLRLSQRHVIKLCDERIVKYRIRNNNENLSSQRNSLRSHRETMWIYEKILTEADPEVWRNTFLDDLKKMGFESASFEDQKICISLINPSPHIRQFAYNRLIDRFNNRLGTGETITFGPLTLSAPNLATILANT